MDAPRTRRMEHRLRQILPLYAYMDLTIEALGETVRCSAPLSKANTNHFGVMHAGILFSLAEAVGGISISQHREFSDFLLLARHVAITYKKPARSMVTGTVRQDEAFLQSIRTGLQGAAKHRFDVAVDLQDEAGDTVSQSLCSFQLQRI